MEHLSDVVLGGALVSEFTAAQMEFTQSQSHTFYIRGSTDINGDPTVFSLTNDDSDKELMAIT